LCVYCEAGGFSIFLPQITQKFPVGQKPFFILGASSDILYAPVAAAAVL
jgi:hypothetical protein